MTGFLPFGALLTRLLIVTHILIQAGMQINSQASGNSKRRKPRKPTSEEGENTNQTADLSTNA
jgi:hypothetical protein